MEESPEKRRKKNRNLLIFFFLLVLGLAVSFEIRYFGLGKFPIGNSVAFLTIINLNLILLMVLALLVGRNLVKLYFERRQRLPGAKFRTRLVVSFLALSLIPTILLFLLASGFLTNILEKWLNLKVEETLTNSLEVAKFYYNDSKERTLHSSKEISYLVMNGNLLDKDKEEDLLNLLEQKRSEYGLKMVKVFTAMKKELASARDPEIPKDIPLDILEGPLKGTEATNIVSTTKGELILGAFPIYSSGTRKDVVGALVVATYVPQNLLSKMESIHGAFEEYKQLHVFKIPIKITYLIIFLMATLLIIFSATWIGFYMAKDITIPVQSLIEATHSVARGDLDSKIEIKAKDEMGSLVDSFNRMIEDLRVSKTELIKAQRVAAWQEVAKRIAHEVKNPLTPIQLSAQRLSKRYRNRFSEEEGRIFDECTRTIIKQVDELKALVDEFSSFARMPSANPTPNDINEIIKEVVALYQDNQKDITFSLNLDETLPIMDVDRDQMKRVFINLIDNAVSSIDGHGMIILKTRYDKEYKIVRIEVTDTGCGIPEEDKERLFEPYFSTKKSGTGLGLAIVNDIITDHRGYIRVKDNKPRGSRVIIELPARGVTV
jgi:nitrogen fixation/metabolism regulation signal transduction histidine kinase